MIKISKSIIEKDGEYLLLKRSDTSKSFPGLWDFAGGKDNPGETPEQSVVRETKEETDFDVEPGEMVKKAEYHDDQYDLLFHYFTPTILSGQLKLSHDHSGFKWVPKDEIKNFDLHPCVILYFD